MRIAVLGDIHSNHIALEACLEWIDHEYIDGIAFIGDYVTDCPYPRKTMELIHSIPDTYRTWFVRGNREDYLLEHMRERTDGWRYCSQNGSLLYTFEELTGSDLRFFEGMPIGMEIAIDGLPPVSICHAAMQDDRLLFDWQCPIIDEVMREQSTRLMLCGHSHTPYIYRNGGKTLVNVGACGMPESGRTDASMVVIESEGEDWTFEHILVPYDTERVVQEFTRSRLIEKANVWSRAVIATLRSGHNYYIDCVALVKRFSRESGLPFYDESLWQRAAQTLDI